MQLLDKEDEEHVVEDNFERFQKMYHPVWKEHFTSCFDLKDGKFSINRNDPVVKKHLLMQINENVYKNIDRFSVLLFDEQSRLKKQKITL